MASPSGHPPSGHNGSTSMPPISGQDTEITSIIGFVAVLIILVAAVLAVICLCTCYGVLKLHSQPTEATATPNSNSRRGLVPLPSPGALLPPQRLLHDPRVPLPPSIIPLQEPPQLSTKNKSPSFQNSPYYINALTPPPSGFTPCPPLRVSDLAHIPPSASCDNHLCQRGSRQTTAHHIPTEYSVPSTGMDQYSDNSAEVSNVTVGAVKVLITPKGNTAKHVRSYSTEV